MDLALGGVLLVAAIPVIVLGALLSAVALRSWPLFTQERLGTGGRTFRILKLRTMPASTPRYALKSELADLRLPWPCRMLRRTHLDELPQLFNVLAGDLSLVGPRPKMPDRWEVVDPTYRLLRTSVPQGCTGLWQISTQTGLLPREHPEYDEAYLGLQSLRFDLWVLWRTLLVTVGLGRPVSLDEVNSRWQPSAAGAWEPGPVVDLRDRRRGPGSDRPGEGTHWPAPLPRPEVAGLCLDPVTEAQLVERILGDFRMGQGGWVVTANADILRQVTRDAVKRDLVGRSSIVVADGMPLVWASRLAGRPVPERVAGSSVLESLSAAAAAEGVGVFLLGGEEGVAEQAAAVLRRRHPGLRVGSYFPPFGFEDDPDEMAALEQAVSAFGPALFFCGLGFPKQEKLMARLAPRHTESWFLACGAGIAFLAGAQPRAPRWMQVSGLEWLHRLSHEPVRLARRYLIEDLPFTVALLAGALRHRSRRPSVSLDSVLDLTVVGQGLSQASGSARPMSPASSAVSSA